jgi:hypothetical protein
VGTRTARRHARTARHSGGPARRFLIVLGTIAALVVGQAMARALDAGSTPTTVVGNTTWFSGLGSPYGGCGLPQDVLDSQDFIALNVFNTPGDYNAYPRPLTGANASKIGMWNNGLNCGRWVQVTVDDYCTGTNDGAPGQPFCRNGSWVSDAYKGATLTMLVADSCGDSNAWCRDDPYHIDLSHDSLNRFRLNGKAVGDMDPAHFNNRHMKWQFVKAPNYTGDIGIGFLQGAQKYWGAVALSHLANGLHGVQYYSAGGWHDATMNGDMGQSYVLKPITDGGTQFRLRAKDASDAWVNNAREYTFSLPSSCVGQCSAAYTQVTYTTTDPGGAPSPTTSTSAPAPTPTSPTGTPTTTTPAPTTTAPTTTAPAPTTNTPTTTPTTTAPKPTTTTPTGTPTTTSPAPTPTDTCTVSFSSVTWPKGQLTSLTVTNTGSSRVNGWKLAFDLPPGQNIVYGWNAAYSPVAGKVTAANLAYDGIIDPGTAVRIGFVTYRTGAAGTPASFTLNGARCTVR